MPMKSATNGVFGSKQISRRSCLMDDAAFRTTIMSDMESASDWSASDINRGKPHLLNITEFHADAFAQLRIQTTAVHQEEELQDS